MKKNDACRRAEEFRLADYYNDDDGDDYDGNDDGDDDDDEGNAVLRAE
jgi:hypothetical protein